MIQAVRYGARALRANRVVTAIAVLTLGLAIGADAAMFAVLDPLLLQRPPHVTDPDRVVRLDFTQSAPGPGSIRYSILTYPRYRLFRDRARSFSSVGAYAPQPLTLSLGVGSDAQPVRARLVSPSFFTTLGVRPVLGRFFTDGDGVADNSAQPVVLGYEFWRRHFAGSHNVVGTAIGTAIDVGRSSYIIAGVAPQGFGGIDLDVPDLWLPLRASAPAILGAESLGPNTAWLEVVGRLRPNATTRAATAEARVIFADRGRAAAQPSFGSVREVATGSTATPAKLTLWLGAACGMVLLIACANVAGLSLARGAQRRREIGIRLALGASRGAIARQLVAENAIIAGLGAIVGLTIASWAGSALRSFFLPYLGAAPVLDYRVAVFAIGAAVVSLILAGVAPAVRSSTVDLVPSLASSRSSGAIMRSPLRAALIAGQVALTVMLLATAGLFLQSLRRAGAIPLGFDAGHLLSVTFDFAPHDYTPESIDAAYTRLRDETRAIPGIAGASLVAGTVFGQSAGVQLTLPGRTSASGATANAPMLTAVTPDYFRTTGERIVRGRAFSAADVAGAQPVAVINQTLADAYWPGSDPIGQCFTILDRPSCVQVVGVVQDARVYRRIERPEPQFYVPLAQRDLAGRAMWPVGMLLVRTHGQPDAMVRAVRSAIVADPMRLPYPRIGVVADRFDRPLRDWRLGSRLLIGLGGMGLVLAAVGLYGLLSYLVAQRTHEMAVRLSLGAEPRHLVRLVLGQGLRITLAGLIAGAIGAVAIGHTLTATLYSVSAASPAALAAATLVLLLIAALSIYRPARRATRIDPMVALRAE